MKGGHIAAVEYPTNTTDDGRVAASRRLFEAKGKPRGAEGFEVWAEGFEVWDGLRFVYRYPEGEQSVG